MTKADTDLDALFTLPLAGFTAARNALVKRLKQSERSDEAAKVMALSKPSISAWAVNQLYWKHRNEFDRLLAAGAHASEAHAAQLTGKKADVRGALAARREAISALLNLADGLLRAEGHSASPEMMRRIETTLEALSASSSFAKAPMTGRLTDDVGPLGFESLTGLVPDVKPATPAPSKAALKTAEQTLRKARTLADAAAKALKEATAQVKAKEKALRQAEERLAQAKAAMQEAHRIVSDRSAAAESTRKAVEDAERVVESVRSSRPAQR